MYDDTSMGGVGQVTAEAASAMLREAMGGKRNGGCSVNHDEEAPMRTGEVTRCDAM